MATQQQDRMAWFHEARFGIFLHWGMYSVSGVEASWPIMTPGTVSTLFGPQPRISYRDYVAQAGKFNPERYNAREWVAIAQDAGAKYMILTAKHHDGFCMFDAPGTDYKITNGPFRRDVCAEFAQACSAAGMRYGFYYSQPDMHHPGYRDTTKRNATGNWFGQPERPQWADYLDYMESHLRRLLTDYGDVSVLWFDGLANLNKYQPARFMNLIRELKPEVLVNDRLGPEFDYITPEQTVPKGVPVRRNEPASKVAGGEDFFKKINKAMRIPFVRGKILAFLRRYAAGELDLDATPTAPCPSADEYQPWETCMTLNQAWGYVPTDTKWKSIEQLVKTAVGTASAGGNFLLNVGPRPDGTFPPEAVERLAGFGRWFRAHAQAVRGTTYDCLSLPEGVKATRAGAVRYLFLTAKPTGDWLTVDGLDAPVEAVAVLNGVDLPFVVDAGQLRIDIRALPADALVPVIAVR